MKKGNVKVAALLLALSTTIFVSCDDNENKSEEQQQEEQTVDTGDFDGTAPITADFETEPLQNRAAESDVADDIAVWVNPENSEDSYIIGTDKFGGLAVYDFTGAQVHYYADGNMDNVDLRYDFSYQGASIAIVGCTNRTTNTVDFYKVGDEGALEKLPLQITSDMQEQVYGFALGQYDGNFYAFADSKLGEVEQWRIYEDENGNLAAEKVRIYELSAVVEGVVADDKTGTLFIAVEDEAIYYASFAEDGDATPTKIESSAVATNDAIEADIEGLAVYRYGENNYLLASSQGNSTYAIFDLDAAYEYIGSFAIEAGVVDGTDETRDGTDGIEAISVPIGDAFPYGVFIAQDNDNMDDGVLVAQDFKVVDWRKIQAFINTKK